MKILVVDFAASEGGALSVLKDYYEQIKNDKENEYVFLLNDYYVKETDNIEIIKVSKYKPWLKRLLFDYFVGKKYVKRINPDIVLSFQNTMIRGINKKKILYIHQSIPFQNHKNFSFFNKKEFKLAIIQKLIGKEMIKSIKISDKIIVQTKWMRDAILEKCKIDKKIIEVSMPKVDLSLVNKENNVKQNVFFYPTSSNDVYKNCDLIHKAVELLIKKNITDFKVNLTLNGNNSNNINYLGRITREKVFNNYSNSVLVFPSYIESCPLPLIEARNSDTIILASDTKFSHEILDDYKKAYFFDPFNETELAELMSKCINKKL